MPSGNVVALLRVTRSDLARYWRQIRRNGWGPVVGYPVLWAEGRSGSVSVWPKPQPGVRLEIDR